MQALSSSARKPASHPHGIARLFIGQDKIRVQIEVGMFARGILPAVQESFLIAREERRLCSHASGNPIALRFLGVSFLEQLNQSLFHSAGGWIRTNNLPLSPCGYLQMLYRIELPPQ